MTGAREEKTTVILEKIKKRKSLDQVVDVNEATIKLVIVTMMNEPYAFLGRHVREILRYVKINFVPGAPDYVLGIINLRGDIESVIDIHRLLELPELRPIATSRIVIAEDSGIRSGILVGSVDDVIDVPESVVNESITTLSEGIRDFVVGEVVLGERSVTILDIGKIFAQHLARSS